MNISVREIYDLLNYYAPFFYQEDWDNSGLQIGNKNTKVKRVLLSLDVTYNVVLEAKKIGAQLIVSHHPLFFKPLPHIDTSNPLIKMLIEENISVISSHTPLDLVPDGVSFYLASLLKLNNKRMLSPLKSSKFYKLFFFLPTGSERSILNHLFSEGIGEYLFYKDCAFESFGEGRFKKKGERKSYIKSPIPYKEAKIELVVRKDKIDSVISKLREIHPYDELAFDVFEEAYNPINLGYGCIGELSSPMKISMIIDNLKEVLGIEKVRFIGDLKKKIKKVAIVGGSGSSFASDAQRAGAELFISGDIKYHCALEYGEKLSIIDVGHRASEEPILLQLKELFSKRFKDTDFYIYKEFGDLYKYI